ncbi:hypothetical protein GCM10025794_29460 [Massilia kyonggiensis]
MCHAVNKAGGGHTKYGARGSRCGWASLGYTLNRGEKLTYTYYLIEL